MTGSKFSGLKAMREKRNQDAEVQPTPEVTPESAPVADPPRRKVGRPPGKRSNPDYQQVTVLLHAQTYLEVRKRLLEQRTEVSDLINDLLSEWLKR
jgi:hypothetical protein